MYFTSETEFINPDFPSEKTILLADNKTVDGILIKAEGRERKFRKISGM
jgi:hypothetical protein